MADEKKVKDKRKDYRVVHPTPINVQLLQRQPDEVFKAELDTEIKNLIFHNYIKEVKKDGNDKAKATKGQ